MKNRFIIFNLIAVVLLVTTWLVKSQITNVSTNSSDRFISNEERERTFFSAIRKMLNTPIDFHGKVVDEKGNPIEGADITYTVTDKLWEDGKKHNGKSDAQGLFSFSSKGALLTVSASKKGYYRIYEKSSGTINFSTPKNAAPVYRPIPTRENPCILVLQKIGEIDSIIEIENSVSIPRDGTPVEISLRKPNRKGVPRGQGDIEVRCWTFDQNKNEKKRYDWRFQLSVPGGGLVTRNDIFNFVAPEIGYVSSYEFSMSKDAERWRPDTEKLDFFIKLKDGNYARIKFEMIAGGDHFLSIKSYLNPTGSRNLEAGADTIGNPK